MSSTMESTARFFRPADAGRTRRNYRQVQVQRLLVVARNVVIGGCAIVAIVAGYRHVKSGPQFAIQHIEISGAVHTPRAALDAVTRQYAGLNLFAVDIARVRRDLGALAWVRHVDISEKVPDTLRIRIEERTPVALLEHGGVIDYVDQDGVTFAELSPAVGDADLPVIDGASGADLTRSVALLRDLRAHDPQLYARISEVRPIAPASFAIFDRELAAFVYVNASDVSQKWRDLRAIIDAESLKRGDLAYADLRFDGRVIVKPVNPKELATSSAVTEPPNVITN